MYMNSAKFTLLSPITRSTDWNDSHDINFLLPVRNYLFTQIDVAC